MYTKDGFYKALEQKLGDDAYLLLAAGGHKKLAELLESASLGASGNNTTLSVTVGGTTKSNSITIPYASSAAQWATTRTLTIGSTGKSVNGSANVTWSLDEIGVYSKTAADDKYKLKSSIWIPESKIIKEVLTTYLDNTANLHNQGVEEINFFRFFAQGDESNYLATYGYPVVDQHMMIFSIDGNKSWIRALSFDIRSNDIYTKTKNGSTWRDSWVRFLHSGNYTDYTVTKTGGGASGTWGINITGNAGTATTLQTSRNLKVNLASSSSQSFNGSADATSIGVAGTLSFGNLPTMYWANVSVSTTSSTTTVPTFNQIYTTGPLYVGCNGFSPYGNWNEGIRLYGTSTSGSWSKIDFGCTVGSITGSHSNQWSIGRNTSNQFFFGHGTDSSTPILLFDTNNYVGIGTATPSNKLHISGGNGVKIEGDSGGPYLTINYNSRYDSDNSLDNYGINLIKFGKSAMDNYLGTGLNTGNSAYFSKQSYVFHTGSSYAFGWYTSGWTNIMELEANTGNLWIKGWVYANYLHSRGSLYVQGTSYFGRNSYGDTYYINGPNYTGTSAYANALASQEIITAISGTSRYSSGLRFGRVYNSGYPFSYGNTITIEDGGFGTEIIFNGIGGGGATGSGEMRFRTHSDWSTSEWGDWRTVIDSVNISSQSVSYANSAGSVAWGNVTGKPSTFTPSSHTHDDRYLRKDTNDSTPYQYSFTKTNDHAIQVGTIRGRSVSSQSGEYIHLYERVHIGSPSGWGSRNAPTYGLSTYGGAWLATDTGNVGIGTTSPDHKLAIYGNYGVSIYGNFNYHPLTQDGNWRPGLSISGNYPYIWITGGSASNTNHGSTLTLAALDGASSTSGSFKGWTFGVPGYNATWMDLGYGSSTNPHEHGIAGYTSGWSGRVMRWTPDQTSIWGTGNDCAPSLIVNSSRNGSWVYGGGFMAPNLTGGNNIYVPIGQSMSTRNAIGLTHYHYGSGSTSNYAAMEIWGVGNIQRWYYGDLRTWFGGRVDSSGFYHNSYGSSAYALTSDGGVAHIGSMSVNYANSAGSAGSADYAHKLDIYGYTSGGLSFYQTANDFDGHGSGWSHYIIANHGDGASYYHYTIALPFWGPPQYRRQTGSTSSVTGWYTFLTTENWSSYISASVSKSTDCSSTRYVVGTDSTSGNFTTAYCCAQFYFTSSGAYHTSDIRKKYDIRDIYTDEVTRLFNTDNAFIRHFKWKDTDHDAYGFIAQELAEYCPEAVDLNNDTGYYAVNYNVAFSKIIGAMYKRVKQLENENNDLKLKIEDLYKLINKK